MGIVPSRKNSSIISSSPSAIISTSFHALPWRRRPVRREISSIEACRPIGLVNMGLHGHQINDAAESSFRADRQLKRDDVAPENLLQRFHRAFETGELTVHPGENEGTGMSYSVQ